MVRVLHIGRSMNRGGIETFIMNVYRTIDRSKIQFDFLLNMGNGDYVINITDDSNLEYVMSLVKTLFK